MSGNEDTETNFREEKGRGRVGERTRERERTRGREKLKQPEKSFRA